MKTQNSKLNPPHSPAIRSGGQVWRIKTQNCESGSAIAFVIIALVILAALGVGLLTVAYGVRHDAIQFKNETVARLAAEAGYEQALYEMSKQGDILSELQKGAAWTSGSLSLPDADCDYQIKLFSFAKYRPVYQVISTGHSGVFDRVVDVRVIQAISGWDMGKCRVPNSSSTTTPVYFAGGEIVDMPLHINNLKDSPDNRDIYITGSPSPRFLQDVGMGESRYDGSTDKYASVIGLFEGGIYFNQPDCKITDEAVIQSKVDRFKNSTKTAFRYTPTATAPIAIPSGTSKLPATQLEFFVEGGVGKVRITNDCTVLGYRRDSDSKTYDFKITPKSGGTQYEKYYIYAYHVKSTGQTPIVVPLTDSYTTQSFGGVESEPGGQIFVEGNVVIGGNNASSPDQVIKGTVSVVATGNIWIADSVRADGPHDATTGMPTSDNSNAIGLVAQGVIKVVDPGISSYATSYSEYGGNNNYPGPPTSLPSGYEYAPVAHPVGGGAPYDRYLSDPTVVEAAITVGGGGWGAENVARSVSGYGGRKELSSPQDSLIVRGTITEAVRGVVGLVGTDGYLKHYYLDWRLLTGILPGDIWLRGKYIPAPGGWHDYRAAD
jgi:hypothetical protein